ncbi:MiaB/RimO family radical SAM methylthiotransferase [bacterium]|nr:MiaB/RimO family radical SAM methylthiotransferase [bacterium]
MSKIYLKNFGCKVNAAELLELGGDFSAAGFDVAEVQSLKGIPSDSDAFLIINGCTVTSTADAKLRGFVRRAQRHAPRIRIIVGGCTVRAKHFRREELPGVVFENHVSDSFSIVNPVNEDTGKIAHAVSADRAYFAPANRARAIIRAQDGCDCSCSFCIVPLVRPAKSISRRDVLARVSEALSAGIRELVLTGTNIGKYVDEKGRGFVPLLLDILDMANKHGARVRVSSIEPEDVDFSVIDLFGHPDLCQHLHLPLQSGSPRILQAMNRRYSIDRYMDVVGLMRSRHPAASITTDIIVGFPGETDDDFGETLEVVSEAGFERIHIFRYSPRPGTSAFEMKSLPERISRERMRVVQGHSDTIILARMNRHLGKEAMVLIEDVRGGFGRGYSGEYFRVHVDCSEQCTGKLVRVKLEGKSEEGVFTGSLLERVDRP